MILLVSMNLFSERLVKCWLNCESNDFSVGDFDSKISEVSLSEIVLSAKDSWRELKVLIGDPKCRCGDWIPVPFSDGDEISAVSDRFTLSALPDKVAFMEFSDPVACMEHSDSSEILSLPDSFAILALPDTVALLALTDSKRQND